jgi:peptidoglycan DL-endopeptidase CwlO
MTRRRRSVRALGLRLVLAAILVIPASALMGGVSSARPTQADLDAAKAQLVSLNQRLSSLVEDYDAAKMELNQLKGKLRDAEGDYDSAAADASIARAYLAERAAQAYMGGASAIDVLLGSSTFTDFTDRAEFLGDVAQADADAAATAEQAGQRAARAQTSLQTLLAKQRDLIDTINQKTADIESSISEQQALIDQLTKELSKPVVQKIVEDPGPPPTKDPDPSPPPPPPPPPPPSSGAQAAVDAAYSVLGVPYKWGGDNPDEGFDCSGLTMWSWAHAGVSLPHSSAAQYAVLPHVDKADLKPGDLLFFYTPIHHVAIYVGNNQMIHATHPGSTVQLTTIASYYWAIYSGAGRPGT